MRIGAAGRERPVAQEDGRFFDLTPLTQDVDAAFLAGEGIERSREAVESGDLPTVDLTGLAGR